LTRAIWFFLVVALTAAGPARAFVQATVNADGTGKRLHWGSSTVHFTVNDFSQLGATAVCGVPTSTSAAIAAVQGSFAAWSYAGADAGKASCTSFHFVFDGSTSSLATGNDGQNLVVFRHGSCETTVPSSDPCHTAQNCPDTHNCWDGTSPSIIALTSTWFRESTGEIVDADMELNAWDGVAPAFTNAGPFYFTCVDPVGSESAPSNACGAPGAADCIRIDVRNTVTHEAGHVLGLAHNCYLAGSNSYGAPLCTAANQGLYGPATMYPSAPPYQVTKRTLTQDDIDGVCATYPISTGSGGCSQGAGGLASLLGVLGLLVLRRR
jgi:hypothetical protein